VRTTSEWNVHVHASLQRGDEAHMLDVADCELPLTCAQMNNITVCALLHTHWLFKSRNSSASVPSQSRRFRCAEYRGVGTPSTSNSVKHCMIAARMPSSLSSTLLVITWSAKRSIRMLKQVGMNCLHEHIARATGENYSHTLQSTVRRTFR
jgi:hypothetical protein